jgi:arabinan endo-1,5-alpha-L-arabinosidase
MHKIAGWGWVQGSIDNFEAAHIVKKDGYYYLFLSLGGWDGGIDAGYHVVVAKSQSLLGGFKDSLGNDMMSPGDGDIVVDNNREFATGVGHCSVVKDDIGDYWIVYHGYDQTSSNKNTRTLFIDQLLWDEKTSMPYVKDKVASSYEHLGPTYIVKEKKKEEQY